MSADIADRPWDVIVVGAGPAGALSALLAARAGLSTLLVERKRFPRAKVCGGCLNASALGLLEGLGLGSIAATYGRGVHHLDLGLNGRRASLRLPGGVTIPRTRLDAELVRHAVEAGATFLPETAASLSRGKVAKEAFVGPAIADHPTPADAARSASRSGSPPYPRGSWRGFPRSASMSEAGFSAGLVRVTPAQYADGSQAGPPSIPPWQGGGSGDADHLAPADSERSAIADPTRALGGRSKGQAREVVLTTQGVERRVEGRVVVVASGLGGLPWNGDDPFETTVAPGSRIGLGCVVETFPEAYQEGRIAMAIGARGYVGLAPTIEGLAIASALDPGFLKLKGTPAAAAAAILEEAGFPEVHAMATAAWAGTLPLTRSTRPLASRRVFLVGDSAGYVEPFTGQGMAIALQGAVALGPFVAQAVEAWTPALASAWGREYRRKIGSRYWPATVVATLSKHPRLAGWAVGLAGTLPAIPGVLIRAVNRPTLGPSSPTP